LKPPAARTNSGSANDEKNGKTIPHLGNDSPTPSLVISADKFSNQELDTSVIAALTTEVEPHEDVILVSEGLSMMMMGSTSIIMLR
jgi:hypothetical protein